MSSAFVRKWFESDETGQASASIIVLCIILMLILAALQFEHQRPRGASQELIKKEIARGCVTIIVGIGSGAEEKVLKAKKIVGKAFVAPPLVLEKSDGFSDQAKEEMYAKGLSSAILTYKNYGFKRVIFVLPDSASQDTSRIVKKLLLQSKRSI